MRKLCSRNTVNQPPTLIINLLLGLVLKFVCLFSAHGLSVRVQVPDRDKY